MDRLAIVRECFRAYERGDRALIEPHLAADYVFSAPPDVGLDRATYFERCWANAGHIARIDIVREIEHGDEVVVTYELTRTDGGAGGTRRSTRSGASSSSRRRSTSGGT